MEAREVTIRGQRFVVADTDRDFWDLAERGHWESASYDLLDEYCDGRLFIDVGAWIGPLSMYAGTKGPVLALEPDPVAVKALRFNTAHLPVTVRCLALASYKGSATLMANPDGYYGDSMSRLGPHGNWVHTVTPEDLLQTTDACLVKVDIEGGETDVLPTLAPLCVEKRVPLYVSWHEPWWPEPVSEATRRSWFEGFSEVSGSWGGFDTLLAIP